MVAVKRLIKQRGAGAESVQHVKARANIEQLQEKRFPDQQHKRVVEEQPSRTEVRALTA